MPKFENISQGVQKQKTKRKRSKMGQLRSMEKKESFSEKLTLDNKSWRKVDT